MFVSCGVFHGVMVVGSNAEAHLGLLLCWAEHWEAQHMPGWLCPFSTLMSPGQYPILDMGIFFYGQQPGWFVRVTTCPCSGVFFLIVQGQASKASLNPFFIPESQRLS